MTVPVTILSCVNGGTLERLARGFGSVGRTATVHAAIDADEWRAALIGNPSSRLWLRIRSLIGYPASVIVHLARPRDAVLVATTNPFFLPGLVVAMRRFHRAPVIALVYDLWPDAAIAAGRLRPSGVAARIARRYAGWWLRRADAVVFLGDGMRVALIERYGTPRLHSTVPTGADPTNSPPPVISGSEARCWFGRGLSTSYVGNMGAMHDVETVAAAAPLLEEAGLSILVAAWGVGLDRLKASVGEDQTVLRFVDPLGDSDWARVLHESDVALITLRDEAVESSLPSKVFSALAAGAAIIAIAPERSDLAHVVKDTGAGVVVAPGEPQSLAAALREYERDRELLAAHQGAARLAARTKFDLTTLAVRWESLLRQLEKQSTPPTRRRSRPRRAGTRRTHRSGL